MGTRRIPSGSRRLATVPRSNRTPHKSIVLESSTALQHPGENHLRLLRGVVELSLTPDHEALGRESSWLNGYFDRNLRPPSRELGSSCDGVSCTKGTDENVAYGTSKL